MPGCESLEKIGPDEYRMKMKVLLAALSGEFEGKMRIADQAPPTSFRLIVEGSGRIGFLKGDGLLKLAPAATVRVLSAAPSEPPETIVSYEGDAQVGGTMAADLGIDGTSKMMIKKFFDKLASLDRKSTRLNSSHTVISYAVFCLKKKKKKNTNKKQR